MIDPRKIKTLAAWMVVMIVCCNSYAQVPEYTQFYVNPAIVNPGFVGMESFLDFKFGFKQRWQDFDDGNDMFYLTAFGSIGNTPPSAYKKNSLRVSNPIAYDQLSRNKNVKRKHGVGGTLTSQSSGPFETIETGLNYAYHLPVGYKFSLSLGMSVDMIQNTMDFTNYVVRNQNDDFYQQLVSAQNGDQNLLKIDFGSVFYSDKLYIGLSSNALFLEQMSGDEFGEFTTSRSYDLMAGLIEDISPMLEVFPVVRLSQHDLYGLSWDAIVRFRYRQMVYLGVGYFNDVKTSLLLGLTLNGKFNLNYSYDYYVSGLNEFNSGSHEVIIGIALFNKHLLENRIW